MVSDAHNEDSKLWDKCIGGDKEAWDHLVNKFDRLVCRTIIDTLREYSNPPEIDWKDVYQDVFAKLLVKLNQWKRKATLATYIRAIAFRTTIDWLRNRKYVPLENHDRKVEADPVPKIFVRELVRHLRPKERLMVKLLFVEGWSQEEIAGFLGKDIGTVYTMKNRILSKLRTICGKHGLLERDK